MKTFLKIDYHVQFLALLLMIVTLPLFFVPMLILIFFGGWQLLSGLITAIFYKKLDRKHYVTKAIGYLAILALGMLLADNNLLPNFIIDTGIGFFLFWLIIPFGIGIWYYRMVSKDYHKYCTKPIVKSNTMEMNSPFDREELLLKNNRMLPTS